MDDRVVMGDRRGSSSRTDSFSAWLFFLTRLTKGLLCALPAGSNRLAGQLSGQHSYPLLPLTPAECFSVQEWKRNIVHECVMYERGIHSKPQIKVLFKIDYCHFRFGHILLIWCCFYNLLIWSFSISCTLFILCESCPTAIAVWRKKKPLRSKDLI